MVLVAAWDERCPSAAASATTERRRQRATLVTLGSLLVRGLLATGDPHTNAGRDVPDASNAELSRTQALPFTAARPPPRRTPSAARQERRAHSLVCAQQTQRRRRPVPARRSRECGAQLTHHAPRTRARGTGCWVQGLPKAATAAPPRAPSPLTLTLALPPPHRPAPAGSQCCHVPTWGAPGPELVRSPPGPASGSGPGPGVRGGAQSPVFPVHPRV